MTNKTLYRVTFAYMDYVYEIYARKIHESDMFGFLVVEDFAFGEQAQHVMRSLLLTYGRSVRSVNIMGKAGGLSGSRGDILFPTHFINEKSDIPDYRYCL